MLTLRQVTRRDKGRQVHILTTSSPGELPAAGVVYRMTGRWREENYFRYARAHFALDALDSYAVTPDNWTPTGSVDSHRSGTMVYEERTGSGTGSQEVHPGI